MQRHPGHHLLLGCGFAREAYLLAEDVVVVVEDRDVLVAQLPVRAEHGVARVEAIEVRHRRLQALGHAAQRQPHFADVERRIQVLRQHVQVAVRVVIAAGDLANQEKVLLAQVRRKFFDCAAKVARLLERHVLERVDAEAIAVRERDPVLVALGQVAQVTRRLQLEVAQDDKVRTLVLRLGVVDAAGAQVAAARARVVVGVLQFAWPHAILAARDRGHVLSLVAAPGAERVAVALTVVERQVVRRVLPARRAGRVAPVETRMVKDDVQQDAQARLVRRRHQVDQVAACAEARVHVEEVLHAVAVITVLVPALLEHRAQPQRAHAQFFQIRQLGRDAA